MSRVVSALILDMDGVLADTEGIHVRSWDLALEAIGVEATEERRQLAGMSSIAIAQELIRRLHLPYTANDLVERKRVIFRRLIDRGLKPFAGLPEELSAWRGRPLAVATSSARTETTFMLARLGFDGWFEPVVTCDDVTHAKPAPDCYLLAVERLGVPAGECVVVEDSLHGIRAAQDAGARVVAVDTSGLPSRVDGVLGVFDSTVEALQWLRS
jgi:HAD superfamily hydrolase (TIGR01509 family)